MAQAIERHLASKVADGSLPGIVVLAVDGRGDVIHSYAAGTRGVATEEPSTLDTVFWIASCTKALTATACMQLVEQGKLSLDDPVSQYIPELVSGAQVLEGFDDNGEPKLRAPKNQVTLRHLLTHTSGLGYTFFNHDLLKFATERGDSLEWQFKKKDFALPMTFEPGTGFQYGLGIDWAGQVVESVSGKSLENYMKENIFEPCGMRDTTFCIHDRPDMLERLAKPHQRESSGKLVARDQAPYSVDVPEAHHGGAGLFSTAVDYCRFLSMLLNDGTCSTTGKQILKPETVEIMSQGAIKEKLTATTLSSPISGANPVLSNDVSDLQFLNPGSKREWGLSWLVSPEDDRSRAAGSFWWAGIMNCTMLHHVVFCFPLTVQVFGG